jgi:hypothetical protein
MFCSLTVDGCLQGVKRGGCSRCIEETYCSEEMHRGWKLHTIQSFMVLDTPASVTGCFALDQGGLGICRDVALVQEI